MGNVINVTNVYDEHTNYFKCCYFHNSERVKTYQHDGKIYKYCDRRFNNQSKSYNNYYN